MTQARRQSRVVVATPGRARLAAVLALLALPATARPDVITLRGGGTVRGKVIADPGKPDRVQVVLERGRSLLSLEKSQVKQVTEEPGPLDGYVVRRAGAPANAQGQFDLGLYCEQNHLPDLARLHFEAAVKLDAAFGPAHEKLGHALVQGKWLSGDALREAQGMVKYRGRWVTREEQERHQKGDAEHAEETSWARRIRVWRDTLVSGPDDRRREAETQLMALRDPAAVGALVKTLGTDVEPMRKMLAHVLDVIPGNAAAVALARQLVADEEDGVRQAFLDAIERRGEPASTKTLVQALRSPDSAVVNRAGWALGRLRDMATVPNLIGALLSTRERVVMVPTNGPPSEMSAITAGFGDLPYLNGPGAPIAYNGSTVAYLTPPAVGPGVVAFGATSMPAYPMPGVPGLPGPAYGANGIGMFGVSGGMSGGSRGPIPRVVTDTIHNTEVLAALVKLTGQDFGYDQAAWRKWLRTDFRPEPVPAKRVPQP